MTELDPRGLEVALDYCGAAHGSFREVMEGAIRAYLNCTRDATQPEGEPDRIAVVVNAAGDGCGSTVKDATKIDWNAIEADAAAYGEWGPWRRSIVECHLPRPAEPVTVKGRVA